MTTLTELPRSKAEADALARVAKLELENGRLLRERGTALALLSEVAPDGYQSRLRLDDARRALMGRGGR